MRKKEERRGCRVRGGEVRGKQEGRRKGEIGDKERRRNEYLRKG